MLLSSRRALATFLSVMLLTLAFALADERSALAAADDSDVTVFRDGPDVAYPLRHDFSMAIGLPGHGKHEPTSCYDTWGDNYLCRIVSGYEETGDDRNFLVRAKDALDNGPEPRFGHELTSRGGVVHEGCTQWRNGDWQCDYATRKQVDGEHYGSDGWVLKVFWDWAKYTGDQAQCAAALSGLWGGITRKAWLALINDCKNGPL